MMIALRMHCVASLIFLFSFICLSWGFGMEDSAFLEPAVDGSGSFELFIILACILIAIATVFIGGGCGSRRFPGVGICTDSYPRQRGI